MNSAFLGAPFYQDRFRSLGLGLYYDVADNGLGTNKWVFIMGFPFFDAQDHLQSREDTLHLVNSI